MTPPSTTQPPEGGAHAHPAAAARRELGTIVAVTVISAAGIALMTSLHWLRLDATRPAPFGSVRTEVTGRAEFPALSGLAIVALLIAVLTLISGVTGRRLLGVLLAGTGAWCVSYGVRGLARPGPARLRELMPHTNTAAYQHIQADLSAWCPVMVLLLALLLVLAGLALIARASSFSSGLSARYSAPAQARQVDDPWRSLDRGEDPTVNDG